MVGLGSDNSGKTDYFYLIPIIRISIQIIFSA
jgi:hypothetical protein